MDYQGIKRHISNALLHAQMGNGAKAMKEIEEIKATENGFAAVLITSIMAVVVGAVMLYIGLFVTSTVSAAIPQGGMTAAENTTLTGIRNNVSTAFSILGIILIVGGAGGIISVLISGMGIGGVGRQ